MKFGSFLVWLDTRLPMYSKKIAAGLIFLYLAGTRIQFPVSEFKDSEEDHSKIK
jgi:hypothetical protein